MAAQHYYFERIGDVWADPVEAKLQATFSSGVATVDTSTTDPGLTLTRDTTGDYDVAGLPRGRRVHVTGCYIDPASDTPATTTVKAALPRSFNATAGTGKVLFYRGDTGALADPADGMRVFLTVKVETGVYS